MLPVLFSLTLFLNAALLFWVQPLIAKLLLPQLGGSPSVWNTCIFFFQAALLAGYLYALFVSKIRDIRIQTGGHVLLLVCTALLLPFALSGAAQKSPQASDDPALWLIGVLLAAVGLPFLAAATNGPLLQRWFSLTTHRSGRDPYFLFAAGNLGSLLALIGFPLLLEPNLPLEAQSRLWRLLFAVMSGLVLVCGLLTWRLRRAHNVTLNALPVMREVPEPIAVRRLFSWTALAFVPSSLMLGATQYVTTDIAPVPLLWVIPLAIYLFSFVLTFSRRRLISHKRVRILLPGAALLLVFVYLSGAAEPVWFLVPLHLTFLFLACMACHGRLASDRPAPERLVEYFFCIALGGMLGGVFNGLVAPWVFNSLVEYPLGMFLACLALSDPERDGQGRRGLRLEWVFPSGLFLLTVLLARLAPGWELTRIEEVSVIFGIPVLAAYFLRHRPLAFGMAVGAILFGGYFYSGGAGQVKYQARSFFGIHRVTEDDAGSLHRLYHGNTVHGKQFTDPARECEPLAYYHRRGPLGEVFGALGGPGRRAKRAVIGLGIGSMAAYIGPDQEMTFYEIDPLVARIAQMPECFTFLQDCAGGTVRIVLGDARMQLREAPDGSYDLLALDAFSSDAIPVHLLTREAVGLYLSKLAPGGMLAFHISNRTLDLRAVLAGLAGELNLVGYSRDDREADLTGGKDPSRWAVMARRDEDLGDLVRDPRWESLRGHPRPVIWTDDFSNLIGVLRWF